MFDSRFGAKNQRQNKLCSLHASEVECIAKGKAHTLRIWRKGGDRDDVERRSDARFEINPGNPFDRHTLHEALKQAQSRNR